MIKFSSSRIEQIFSHMPTTSVAVIGDLMMDRYVWGNVARISPEAPVPVVSLEGESSSLGGAANVAANIDALGSNVRLYGVVGDDMESQQLRELVKRNKLSDSGIIGDENRKTIVKTRVIAQNQHLIRIDRETVSYLSDKVADKLLSKFKDDINSVSGVILQDYNKGVLTPYLVKSIIEICQNSNIPIAVDPKIENFWSYKNVTLFKPNLRELEAAIAKPIKSDVELEAAGIYTREKLHADNLLVTSGSKGMSLFNEDGVVHIPTRARLVHDVSGAGDTVIATIMTALVAGASMKEAATIATYAASVVVAEVGAVPVDKDKLKREILDIRQSVENSLTYEIKRKLSLASKILSKKILKTVSIFEETFGVPQWRRRDPLDELMLTILSQNTNDRNRDNAYHKLRAQFPTWEKVMQADVELIEGAIRSAGLSKQKSKNMKNALLWINDYFGDLSLDKIRSLSDDEAIELLTSQKGVGIKTAAVMLAFSLDRDLCPVDTHVHRIALRLGWVREKTNAVNTFKLLRVAMPKGKAATFHLNLLRFGREICNARSPKCGGCPLFEVCKWKGRHDFK